MSGAFQIRRIRLLNFHNFVDETLAVRRNLFLIGDNQSGKTTVLDAIHFALSAGVEMEFNAATRFGPRTEPSRAGTWPASSCAMTWSATRPSAGLPSLTRSSNWRTPPASARASAPAPSHPRSMPSPRSGDSLPGHAASTT
jgi:hypothetical protein